MKGLSAGLSRSQEEGSERARLWLNAVEEDMRKQAAVSQETLKVGSSPAMPTQMWCFLPAWLLHGLVQALPFSWMDGSQSRAHPHVFMRHSRPDGEAPRIPCAASPVTQHPWKLLNSISQPSQGGPEGGGSVQEWPDMVQASLARMTEKETAALQQLQSNVSEWAADMPETMPGDSLS